MLAGVNIYEQISCKSDMCIYLMCKGTQLSKVIITHASQCYSGRINKHRYQLWTVMADIKQLSKNSARQSTMLDFFKM